MLACDKCAVSFVLGAVRLMYLSDGEVVLICERHIGSCR